MVIFNQTVKEDRTTSRDVKVLFRAVDLSFWFNPFPNGVSLTSLMLNISFLFYSFGFVWKIMFSDENGNLLRI